MIAAFVCAFITGNTCSFYRRAFDFGWLLVWGLTTLKDSISGYIGLPLRESLDEREKFQRSTTASTASTVGPCPVIIKKYDALAVLSPDPTTPPYFRKARAKYASQSFSQSANEFYHWHITETEILSLNFSMAKQALLNIDMCFTARILHGPSMFTFKAKIYGVLYKQSSSIAFDETSSYWSALKTPNFSTFHRPPRGSLVSIGQHFVATRVVLLPKSIETSLITESDQIGPNHQLLQLCTARTAWTSV